MRSWSKLGITVSVSIFSFFIRINPPIAAYHLQEDPSQIRRFTEYKKWFWNEYGVTFSIQNKILNSKSRLRVQACSYSLDDFSNSTCINMDDADYIPYDHIRIYHINRFHLKALLEGSDDKTKIQFRLQDTRTNQSYTLCQEHPFTQLDVITNAGQFTHQRGQRFSITVTHTTKTHDHHCQLDPQ